MKNEEVRRFQQAIAKMERKLERERIVALLRGIDKTEDDGGWWATSTGAEFGAEILRKIEGES